jgi:hypothetical protein
MIDVLVSAEDHDAGFKEVQLEYRRGDPRDGDPRSVKLIAPSRRAAPAILAGIQAEIARPDGDFMLPATLACLPPELRSEHFLDSLTLECSGRLEAIAYMLTFGAPAQKKMADLLQSIERDVSGSGPNSASSAQESLIGTK